MIAMFLRKFGWILLLVVTALFWTMIACDLIYWYVTA